MSAFSLLALIVVAWLPGAVILRLPIGSREKRAALDADERLFWAVMLSVAASLAVVLGLAAIERYSFQRLLIANVLIAGALAVVARFNLRLGPGARRPGSSAVLAAALVMLGLWRFFPTSEYVIGGKDPGVYIGEGIQIAQRGTLAYDDPVVASVPPFARDLFFPSHERPDYYGIRFMGFFIRNPDTGTVVGQFPHLFPASVAIGYGIRGLSGARETVAAWGILGLLAVYFLGRRLAGTPAAFAAAALLSLHVIEVWFARYPNAEMVMQTLVFAGLLASSRAHSDDDAFFAPVAGVMLGLLLFLRFDAILPLAGFAAGLGLVHLRGGRVRPSLIGTTLLAGLLAVPYYLGPMRAYIDRPLVFLWGLAAWQYVVLGAAIAGGVVMLAAARRWASYTQKIVAFAPPALGAAVVIGAIYGLVFRRQTGKLAIHDAESLRTFTTLYATMPGIVAGLIGYVTAARRVFWRAPEVFTTVAVFSFFLFYKIRIVPEHFWMARRFLAVILPGVLIFACAAASWGLRRQGRGRWTSAAIGAVFVALLASEYARVSRPLIGHVEYAGIIPELEQLASRIGENELLIVESRDAGSDAHVMALPLAYIYARNVLGTRLAAAGPPGVRAVSRVGAQPLRARVLPGRRRYGAALGPVERHERGQPAVSGAGVRSVRGRPAARRAHEGVRLRPLRAPARIGSCTRHLVRSRRRHPRRPERRPVSRQGDGRRTHHAMDAAAVVRHGAGARGRGADAGARHELGGPSRGGTAC